MMNDDAQITVSTVEGWLLKEYKVVNSTNLVAANLSAWEAVRSDTQTAGRGRFQRNWVSDEGGLWLSAVVPMDANTPVYRALPIIAGLAVCEVLNALGVRQLRMRWPNDLLVNDRKLAGLLIEHFTPGLAVVGIGINVSNHPESADPALRNQTARLAGLLSTPPSLHDLTVSVLRNLRRVLNELEERKFPALLPQVNAFWGDPRRVELDLDGRVRGGMFGGIDANGRLILADESGGSAAYEPWQVRLLKEI